MNYKLTLIGFKDYHLAIWTPEIPAHTPKVASTESKRQRRSRARTLTIRLARNLKLSEVSA
jgi:hypothetical protein